MVAALSITTFEALRILPSLPCQPPPTYTWPPPVLPVAEVLPAAARWMLRPSSVTLPPCPAALSASKRPDWLTTPLSPPSSTISPPRLSSPVASTMPLLFTTVFSNMSRPRAVRYTWPLVAAIRPVFSTRAFTTLPLTDTDTSPALSSCRETLSAAASTVLPAGVAMVPLFLTWPPASTM